MAAEMADATSWKKEQYWKSQRRNGNIFHVLNERISITILMWFFCGLVTIW